MTKKIISFFKKIIQKLKIRKFKRFLVKEKTITMHGRVFKIILIGDTLVRCKTMRDNRIVDLYLDRIKINKDGKTYSLKNTSLFF